MTSRLLCFTSVRIVIATTGVLRPEPVADFIERLAAGNGSVFMITVIEVPHSFLDEVRSEQWHPLTDDGADWADQEDALIAKYVQERGGRVTEPLLAALAGRGVEATPMFIEGDDPASAIIKASDDLDADLVVLGATKALFDETQWESVSARVTRQARRPVLVLPSVPVAIAGEGE